MLQLAKLSGLLGLDRHCEACVMGLAANCGAFAPAAPGSVAEAKQLATLQVMLGYIVMLLSLCLDVQQLEIIAGPCWLHLHHFVEEVKGEAHVSFWLQGH